MSKPAKREIESLKNFEIKRACRAACKAARVAPVTSVRLTLLKLPPNINMRDWRMAARARRERTEREARRGAK
ncbi:MAG: hypothetical protein ABL993_08255 [Vicinamibacterales bacterium]